VSHLQEGWLPKQIEKSQEGLDWYKKWDKVLVKDFKAGQARVLYWPKIANEVIGQPQPACNIVP
jgi:hypothetical protein